MRLRPLLTITVTITYTMSWDATSSWLIIATPCIGDRAGRGQGAGQLGQRPGGLADRRPAKGQARRRTGSRLRGDDGRRFPGGREYPLHADGQVAAESRRCQLGGPRREGGAGLGAGAGGELAVQPRRCAAGQRRCHGRSRPRVSWPWSLPSRTCLVRPWPAGVQVCGLPVVAVIVTPGRR